MGQHKKKCMMSNWDTSLLRRKSLWRSAAALWRQRWFFGDSSTDVQNLPTHPSSACIPPRCTLPARSASARCKIYIATVPPAEIYGYRKQSTSSSPGKHISASWYVWKEQYISTQNILTSMLATEGLRPGTPLAETSLKERGVSYSSGTAQASGDSTEGHTTSWSFMIFFGLDSFIPCFALLFQCAAFLFGALFEIKFIVKLILADTGSTRGQVLPLWFTRGRIKMLGGKQAEPW